MTKSLNPRRVLAIDPTSRGFGFAILEGPTTLIDWGVRSCRSATIEKEIQALSRISDLIKHYRPHSLILEKLDDEGSRRCGRIRLLLGAIRNAAAWQGIKVRSIPATKIQKVFLTFNARTKHEIACAVADQLPELAPRLPRPRKPWMTEDYRMAMFDAAALALAHFYSRRVMKRSIENN